MNDAASAKKKRRVATSKRGFPAFHSDDAPLMSNLLSRSKTLQLVEKDRSNKGVESVFQMFARRSATNEQVNQNQEQDNFISEAQFQQVLCHELKFPLKSYEVSRLFENLDIENRGYLTLEQFVHGVRRWRWLRRIILDCNFPHHFRVPNNYNWDSSTVANYGTDEPEHGMYSLVPEYRRERLAANKRTGLSFTSERQLWQNALVKAICSKTDPQPRPWIIFTVGGANVGKNFVMSWLSEQKIVPLEFVVHVNRENLLRTMPEWAGYCKQVGHEFAFAQCQDESSYLETLTRFVAMKHEQHVWVGSKHDWELCQDDPTLRETAVAELRDIKASFPSYRICLLHITARYQVIERRRSSNNLKRKTSSASVKSMPRETNSLRKRFEESPNQFKLCDEMVQQADLVAYINNDEDENPLLTRVTDTSGSWHCGLGRHFKEIQEQPGGFPYALATLYLECIPMLDKFQTDHVFQFEIDWKASENTPMKSPRHITTTAEAQERFNKVVREQLRETPSNQPSSQSSEMSLDTQHSQPLAESSQPIVESSQLNAQPSQPSAQSSQANAQPSQPSTQSSQANAQPSQPSETDGNKPLTRCNNVAGGGFALRRTGTCWFPSPKGKHVNFDLDDTKYHAIEKREYKWRKRTLVTACSAVEAPTPQVLVEAKFLQDLIGKEYCETPHDSSPKALINSLRNISCWHVACHQDALCQGSKTLGLTDTDGNLCIMNVETLVDVISNQSVALGGSLELIVLNGCSSLDIAELLSQQARVPNIICWKSRVEDDVALLFAKGFWGALVEGMSYEQAYEAGRVAVESELQDSFLDCGQQHIPAKVPKYKLGVDPDDPVQVQEVVMDNKLIRVLKRDWDSGASFPRIAAGIVRFLTNKLQTVERAVPGKFRLNMRNLKARPSDSEEYAQLKRYLSTLFSKLQTKGIATDTLLLDIHLSPKHPVNIDMASREAAGIPISAKYFSWLYPVQNVNLRGFRENLEVNFVPGVLSLLCFGGYIYFDQTRKVCSANAVTGMDIFGRFTMRFGEYEPLAFEDAVVLGRARRWHPVTIKPLLDAGAKYFAWILPKERLASSRSFPKYGAFAYLFREVDQRANDPRDRFFPIVEF